MCVSNLTIIASDNGLLPGRRQAIIWTNAAVLLIGPLAINFSEILINRNSNIFIQDMLCTAQLGGPVLKASGRVQNTPFRLADKSPMITEQHTAGGSVSQLSQLAKLSPWLTLSTKDITTSLWYYNKWFCSVFPICESRGRSSESRGRQEHREAVQRGNAPRGWAWEGVSPSHWWGSGGPPPGNFCKNRSQIQQSGAFWGIILCFIIDFSQALMNKFTSIFPQIY